MYFVLFKFRSSNVLFREESQARSTDDASNASNTKTQWTVHGNDICSNMLVIQLINLTVNVANQKAKTNYI